MTGEKTKFVDRFTPTRAPYRIEKTSPLDGRWWVDGYYDDQRTAMVHLNETLAGIKAELLDADGKFIASIDTTNVVLRS